MIKKKQYFKPYSPQKYTVITSVHPSHSMASTLGLAQPGVSTQKLDTDGAVRSSPSFWGVWFPSQDSPSAVKWDLLLHSAHIH